MSKSITIALPGSDCREPLTVQQHETNDAIRLEFHKPDGEIARVTLRWRENYLALEGWKYEDLALELDTASIDRVLYDADEEDTDEEDE